MEMWLKRIRVLKVSFKFDLLNDRFDLGESVLSAAEKSPPYVSPHTVAVSNLDDLDIPETDMYNMSAAIKDTRRSTFLDGKNENTQTGVQKTTTLSNCRRLGSTASTPNGETNIRATRHRDY